MRSIILSRAIPILMIALFIVPAVGRFPNAQTNPQGGTAVSAVSQNSSSTSDPMTFNVTLHGRGATFPAPYLTTAASMYHNNFSNVVVNYNVNVPATGSGAGQKAFMNKTDDFDASDAPLSASQRPLTPGVLHIPETIGSVTMSYNLPGITANLNLTGFIVGQIYLGKILNWSDPAIQSLNPHVSLPNHQIITVHRFDPSGTTFVFTSFLTADNPGWASQFGATTQPNPWPGSQTGTPPPLYLFGNGNGGVASVISSTPYTLGYVELNYAIKNGFTYAKLQGLNGTYVLPTVQSTTYAVNNSTKILPAGSQDWSGVSMINRNGTQTYPMASFTYLLVYQNLNVLPSMDNNETFQANALINFLYWLVNIPGQSLALSQYYVPLPSFVRQIDNASIASIIFTTPAKNTKTVHLSEGASGGWNATTANPNPTITIYSGDTINLVLTSTDSAPHQWYVDYNNDGVLDNNENFTASATFSSPSPTTNPPIVPAIGVNVPAAGNYTYKDADSPFSAGRVQIIQQQVAAVIPEPAALTLSPNHLDNSTVSTIGTLLISMRTLTFSGFVSEISIDTASKAINTYKNFTLSSQALHPVPGVVGVQDRFAINVQVTNSKYPLCTIITLNLNGVTPTLISILSREIDMANNGFVSIIDVTIVFSDFNLSVGNPRYNPLADLVNAGTVNLVDATIISSSYGALIFR